MFDPMIPENLEEIPPGPELARVLGSLDWDRLSDHELVRALQAQDRQVSHYQAGRAWTMDKIVKRYQAGCREDSFDFNDAVKGAACEIGAALCLTRRTAESEAGFSVELLRHRPTVFEALLFGRIDMPRARVLVEETLHVTDAIAEAVLDTLLPEASGLTTGQLRRRIAKLCIDADPEAAMKRYERSVADRRLELRPTCSGTADLLGLDLPPHIATSISRWIHKEARKLKNLGDDRTMDQLRADIYLDLLRRRETRMGADRADADSVPVDGGVHLTVAPETLAGHNDNPGEIRGFGPVIADIARQVADGQVGCPWTWSLRDPDTGQTMDDGITRRRPTAAQRRTIEALNPTCVHPGCRMPSTDCDIDHTVPYSERPVTCTGDLAPLCRHHHRIRHAFGWSYRRLGGGDYLFRSPLGHLHTTSGLPP